MIPNFFAFQNVNLKQLSSKCLIAPDEPQVVVMTYRVAIARTEEPIQASFRHYSSIGYGCHKWMKWQQSNEQQQFPVRTRNLHLINYPNVRVQN